MTRLVLWISTLVYSALTSAHAAAGGEGIIGRITAEASAVGVDSTAIYEVSGVLLEDGPLRLVLDSGIVIFMKPIAGRPVAACFVGAGSASFAPTSSVERNNLQRFYPAEQYNEEINRAVLLFADTAMAEALRGTPARFSGKGLADLTKLLKGSLVYENGTMDSDLLRCLANGWNGQVLTVLASGTNKWECSMSVSAFQPERYTLYIAEVNSNVRSWKFASMCGAEGETIESRDDGTNAGDVIAIPSHTVDVRFERNLDMSAVDNVRCRALMDNVRVIDMELHDGLRVDSVFLDDGSRLIVTHPKKSSRFWIELPRALAREESIALKIFYHGKVIRRYEDYTILETSIEWYPAHSYKQKSVFDLTFTYPDNMKLLCVGERASQSETDDMNVARWVTPAPIRNASFHIGLFKERPINTEKDVPSASMFYRTIDQAEPVSIDVSQALTFYTRLFGPLPIKHLYATELPGTHGEAFPGLLHLSTLAFVKGDDFFAEQFLAHEVAHQWWGIEVDFASYRDQWLSEAFAEYSCLMYSQLASKERNKFFRLLEEYRKQILQRGRRVIGADLKPPSIALGYRVRSGGYSGDYNTYIYYKGAWVLHMLRNMLLNLETMNEDAFLGALAEFYTTYKKRRATTEDFIRIAEKHAKTDLDWFFNQWVYGTEIPTYTYAWKKQRQADGTWKVRLRVQQTNVSESFRMYVPIKVISKNDAVYRLRMLMTGSVAEVDLPLFPDEPDEVDFNDLASVLCDVDEESWD